MIRQQLITSELLKVKPQSQIDGYNPYISDKKVGQVGTSKIQVLNNLTSGNSLTKIQQLNEYLGQMIIKRSNTDQQPSGANT
jgi:hypothetical protein